jgi:hypothetical protein
MLYLDAPGLIVVVLVKSDRFPLPTETPEFLRSRSSPL